MPRTATSPRYPSDVELPVWVKDLPPSIRHEQALLYAKEWARANGYHGASGGWIYNRNERAVCQGWGSFWSAYRSRILDGLTKQLTGFACFTDMVDTVATYRPTLLVRSGKDWRYELLADAYDEYQHRQRDPRRAYRGAEHRS